MITPAELEARLTETQFQRRVVALFTLHQWRLWHNAVAWRSDPGWVDLVCVHPTHGVRFLELKTQRGQLRPTQVSWHDSLKAAGQIVVVLRPSDWIIAQAIARGEIP